MNIVYLQGTFVAGRPARQVQAERVLVGVTSVLVRSFFRVTTQRRSCQCQRKDARLCRTHHHDGGASGAAALVAVALCCPSAPVPWSAEAHFLRGWRDLLLTFFPSLLNSCGLSSAAQLHRVEEYAIGKESPVTVVVGCPQALTCGSQRPRCHL